MSKTAQPGLFDVRNQGDGRFDIRPHYADLGDGPRLTGQNEWLLARLRRGPTTNGEMVKAGLWKYTSRVSEVRKWLENNYGETIVCVKGKGGVNVYRIVRMMTTDGRPKMP